MPKGGEITEDAAMNCPTCRMGTSPEDQPCGRGCKKNSSTAFGLFLVGQKFVPWGANSLVFFEFLCKDMGPGDSHREGPEREESRCGQGQIRLGLLRSRRALARCDRSWLSLRSSQVAHRRAPMQSLKGEAENRYWGSRSTFCHTLFP